MKEIRILCDEIKEELCGAKDYAKKYQMLKTDYPLVAKKYYEMATDELKHAGYFHDMIIDKIKEYKDKVGEPPEYMLDIWNEKHEFYIEEVACIKVILNM